MEMHTYCDADWGGDSKERRSTSGYAVFLGKSLVSWNSKMQNCIALSTMEAEYVSMCEALKETLWIKQLLYELNQQVETTTTYCDNQAAISLVKEPKGHQRSKHIEIKYHFIRNALDDNAIKIEYIKSEDNVADILTKVTTKNKFVDQRQRLGIYDPPTSGSVRV